MILKMTSMCIKGLSFVGLIILLSLFNCEGQEPTITKKGVKKTVLPTKLKKAKSLSNNDISYLVDLKRELKIGDKMVKRIQRVNRQTKSKLTQLSSEGKLNGKNRRRITREKEAQLIKILGEQKYTQYHKFSLKRHK